MEDAFGGLLIVLMCLIGLVVLFSLSMAIVPPEQPQEPPSPLVMMVDLISLSLHAEIAMSAVENSLRARSLIHEAEGARQVREVVRELLEREKAEHEGK